LNAIALYCPEFFYAALLRAAGRALLDVGRQKLHVLLGCMAVLHTWGQNLSLHPHAHCVVPGGGLSEDRSQWVALRKDSYLLPVKVLASRFRTLLCRAVRAAIKAGQLERVPEDVSVSEALRKASKQDWVVYVKPPFGGAEQVLEYVSRYTHRIAISNRRILSFTNNQVTFRWRDYRDGNRQKEMTISAIEFLRRFLMHVLPDRFVRIRYFGLLTNSKRRKNVALARVLLGSVCAPSRREQPVRLVLCPNCYALKLARAQRAQEHTAGLLRSPPVPEAA